MKNCKVKIKDLIPVTPYGASRQPCLNTLRCLALREFNGADVGVYMERADRVGVYMEQVNRVCVYMEQANRLCEK